MSRALPSEDLDLVLEHTSGFWPAFSGARVFVTGGTGFLGMWLLEVLRHANRTLGCNISVQVLSRNPERARLRAPHIFGADGFRLLHGDVASFAGDTGPIDICIHAAADVADTSRAGDPLNVFTSGVQGTANILQLAVRQGATHFLLTSSGAVYGVQPPGLGHMSEDHPGAPDCLDVRTAYGQAKRASEWLACACAASHPMRVSIARIFALLGPGIALEGPFAAGNFIRDALAGRDIQIQGDGRPLRSYFYMADACIWLLRMLQDGIPGKAYNVGSEQPISIADLAQRVRGTVGAPVGVDVRGRADPGVPAARYVPDTSRARRELGLCQLTDLDEALRKTVAWCRTESV